MGRYGPELERLVLIAHLLNVDADIILSGTRGLNISLCPYLHPYVSYASIEGSGETA